MTHIPWRNYRESRKIIKNLFFTISHRIATKIALNVFDSFCKLIIKCRLPYEFIYNTACLELRHNFNQFFVKICIPSAFVMIRSNMNPLLFIQCKCFLTIRTFESRSWEFSEFDYWFLLLFLKLLLHYDMLSLAIV